jgi:hypothetical protein
MILDHFLGSGYPKMHQNTGNHIYLIQNFVASLSLRLVEVRSHVVMMKNVTLFIMKVAHPWSRSWSRCLTDDSILGRN